MIDTMLCAPSDASRQAARAELVADLDLTHGSPLSALADHWEDLTDMRMPIDTRCAER